MAGEPKSTFFSERTALDYPTVILSPHRNAPPRVRPPCLVSHVCFWNPQADFAGAKSTASADTKPNLQPNSRSDAESPSLSRLRRERRARVDSYIGKIWHAIDKSAINVRHSTNVVSKNRSASSVEDKCLLLYNHYIDHDGNEVCYERPGAAYKPPGRSIIIAFRWYASMATIRVEQHTEYTALTCFIDLSRHYDDDKPQPLPAKPIPEAAKAIDKLKIALDELNTRVASGDLSKSKTETDAHDDAYFAIWDAFYNDVLQTAKEQEKGLGEVFVDIRGMILGSPLASVDKCEESKIWFQPPFWRKVQDEFIDNDKFFGNFAHLDKPLIRSGLEVVMRFWQFIKVRVGDLTLLDHEIVACSMQGRQAVYISGLGVQPRDPTSRPGRFPLIYFLYCNTLDGWQIGRLVGQLHHMGSQRLAAMKHFDRLVDSGYDLRDIAKDIEKARVRFEQVDDSDATSSVRAYGKSFDDSDSGEDCPQSFDDTIRQIDDRIARMQTDFDGNIAYRMQRSLQYIRQFRASVPSLRIRRIEGFQPYDKFVERRLGSLFELIELLTAQFESLKRARADLFQYYLTQKTVSLEAATKEASEEVSNIQRVADFALWFVLIPYYAGTIVFEHILDICNGTAESFGMWATMWVALVIFGIGQHLFMKLKNKGFTRWMIFVAAGFLLLTTAVRLESWELRALPGGSCHSDGKLEEIAYHQRTVRQP